MSHIYILDKKTTKVFQMIKTEMDSKKCNFKGIPRIIYLK